MLMCLTFVPEIDDIDCSNILTQEDPQTRTTVAKYFEDNYTGKQLTNGFCRTPTFPIEVRKMHQRGIDRIPRTNNM